MGSYTSSERRGILIIAGLALAVTGAGLIVSQCNRGETTLTPQDVEVLYRPASQGRDSLMADSLRKVGKEGRSRDRKNKDGNAKKSKQQKEPKVYRRRNRLDESAQ